MRQPITLTRAAFARHIKRSKSYITKLAQEGRLVLTEDGKKVLVKETKTLIKQTDGTRSDVADRHQEGREDAKIKSPDAVINSTLEQARKLKAISEARRIAAVADQEEMNRDKQAGNLIARDDVDFVINDYGATLRSLLENRADRLAPIVTPMRTLEETHAAISESDEALARELEEIMRRRAEASENG